MESNITYSKAYAFAVRIVKCTRYLQEEKKEFILSKQFLRSGTSIGANVAESIGAISKADFSAKISIAYKECRETLYWIDLLKDSGYLDAQAHDSLYNDAVEISKILFSILKTTRIKEK